MRSLLSKILSGLGSISIGICAYIPAANAAEQISIRASGFERSVAVADLRKLVNSGELSETLRGLLGTAGLNPDVARGYLAMSIDLKQYEVDVTLVDKFLNSYLVELLLQDLGKSLRPPGAESASVGAIKSAIVGSVADDGKISAIEFFEKYPTELIIEVEGLSRVQDRLSKDYVNLAQPLARLLQQLRR